MTRTADVLTLAQFSPLTEATRRLFHFLRWLSPMEWLRRLQPVVKPRNMVTPKEAASVAFVSRRGRAIEYYVIACLAAEVLLVASVCLLQLGEFMKVLVVALALLRIVEILQVTVNATVFDQLSGRADNRVASSARMLVLAFINFLELCVCFGIVYAAYHLRLHGAGRPVTGFYLSVITQPTIGYGDVYPTSFLRVVAAAQGIAAVVFVILVFARIVGMLPTIEPFFETEQLKRAAEQADAADEAQGGTRTAS